MYSNVNLTKHGQWSTFIHWFVVSEWVIKATQLSCDFVSVCNSDIETSSMSFFFLLNKRLELDTLLLGQRIELDRQERIVFG